MTSMDLCTPCNLHDALKLHKEIHIFLSSGTSLILEGPSGYSYAMQRGLDFWDWN